MTRCEIEDCDNDAKYLIIVCGLEVCEEHLNAYFEELYEVLE